MTSEDIAIDSTNFKVDKNGNMTCNNANVSGTITSSNATITGGNVTLQGNASTYNNATFKINSNSYKSYMSSSTLELYNNSLNRGIGIAVDGIGAGDQISCYSSGGTQYVGLGFGDINATGDVYCNSVIPSSLENKKKNFEKLQSGLDIIKDIEIYKYHFKDEDDKIKKHIGFVIGDKYKYSKEVTSDDNTGVDLYSFISVCCKAIQEQQEEIEQLKEQINKMEVK